MTPFEVTPTPTGYTWRIIAPCGRALVYPQQTYPCDRTAADAARKWRDGFAAAVVGVDG